MTLGAFSISLAVKSLAKSREFYEKLGFEVVGGKEDQNWLILRNGDTTIGLFQGMFVENIMTFNPGWDSNAQPIRNFTDVRVLQQQLVSRGIALDSEADEASSGPSSFMISDPDGNTILVDQHVGAPS